LSAAIFFIVHNIFAKTNLFLIGGIIERHAGTQELKKLGGFLEKAPLLAILFLISALALAGLPPLSGFWAKLGVIQASFRAEAYWLGGIALFTSILTLVSMLKIWNQAFWAPESEPKEIKKLSRSENFSFYFPVIILASLTFVMGIRPQLIFDFTQIAAVQMQDPSLYRSVLGLKLMEDPSNVESGEEQNP
jgi:multicomponent Na+:H+ antiporter subunit D